MTLMMEGVRAAFQNVGFQPICDVMLWTAQECSECDVLLLRHHVVLMAVCVCVFCAVSALSYSHIICLYVVCLQCWAR